MIGNAIILLRDYTQWGRKLPRATDFIFAARTPLGRSLKIFLFGIGVVLPQGSLRVSAKGDALWSLADSELLPWLPIKCPIP